MELRSSQDSYQRRDKKSRINTCSTDLLNQYMGRNNQSEDFRSPFGATKTNIKNSEPKKYGFKI